MQSTNVQSTTGNLPVGKRHYGQRTSWQRPIGLNTTGKWMLGKMLRGQYDWQANYDRPATFSSEIMSLGIEKNDLPVFKGEMYFSRLFLKTTIQKM